jgi:hypothetical protein
MKGRTISRLEVRICEVSHPYEALTSASGAGICCSCSGLVLAFQFYDPFTKPKYKEKEPPEMQQW